MTRQFNPLQAGLDPKAVEELYNIVLTQKLVLEAKLDRIKKELAVGACAIEDGNANLEQAGKGMLNLIAYIEAKVSLESELNLSKGSIELVEEHLEAVKAFHSNRG